MLEEAHFSGALSAELEERTAPGQRLGNDPQPLSFMPQGPARALERQVNPPQTGTPQQRFFVIPMVEGQRLVWMHQMWLGSGVLEGALDT
jgi:hypothetical protein